VWDVYIRAYTSSGPDSETGVTSAFRKMLRCARHKKAVFGIEFLRWAPITQSMIYHAYSRPA